MGYTVYLNHRDGRAVSVGYDRVGTIALIGVRDENTGEMIVPNAMPAIIDITFNYNNFFKAYVDGMQGLYWISGRRAGDCIYRLSLAVGILGTERSDSYWDVTEGNAGHVLSILLSWAELYPEAVFEVHG